MIRDRGRIKWVTMMLPEHVKLLREYNESLDKAEKPVLDEQKYEEFYEINCVMKMPIFKSPISQYLIREIRLFVTPQSRPFAE